VLFHQYLVFVVVCLKHTHVKRILALIPCLPYPQDRGAFRRYAALIDALSRAGEVHCFCLCEGEIDDDNQRHFAQKVYRLACVHVQLQPWKSWWRQVLDPLPANVRHWFDESVLPELKSFVHGLTFDEVVLGDLVSIPYHQHLPLSNAPVWLDRLRVDVEYQRQKAKREHGGMLRRLGDWLRCYKVLCYEKLAAGYVTTQIVCSQSDANALKTLVGVSKSVEVVVNGFTPSEFQDLGDVGTDPTFMFVGAMDYQPNVDGALWFAQNCWPLICQQIPQARWIIAGRDPVPEITALVADSSVEVTGTVPSLIPYYQRARCVVAPIHIGGGSRLKIIEAWALGRPLVATPTAMDGFAYESDIDCLCAEDAESFAAHCMAIAQDDKQASALRIAGLERSQSLTWPSLFTRIERFISGEET
jgi:glycosyltransferase involved in cell wall biosynthesis